MYNFVDHVVEIAGSRCLVLRDEAGVGRTTADALIVQANALGDGVNLWLSAEVMEDAVAKNGMLPVYGLWQILLASGLIKEEFDVHVVETSEEGDGHYLLKMGHTWQVGVLFQGELQGLPDEALKKLDDGEFNVNIIEFELDDLALPAKRVLSALEHKALNVKRKKEFNLRLAAVFSFTLLIVYGIDTYYEFQHDKAVIDYESRQQVLSSLRSTADLLKKSRATAVPDQTEESKVIWYAVSKFPANAVSAEKIRFNDRGSNFVVAPEYAHIAFDLPSDSYDVRVNNDGEAIVSWQVPAGGQ